MLACAFVASSKTSTARAHRTARDRPRRPARACCLLRATSTLVATRAGISASSIRRCAVGHGPRAPRRGAQRARRGAAAGLRARCCAPLERDRASCAREGDTAARAHRASRRARFTEEQRTRLPSVFTRAARADRRCSSSPRDTHLGSVRRVRLRPHVPVRSGQAAGSSGPPTSATSCCTCPTSCSSSTTCARRAQLIRYDFEVDGTLHAWACRAPAQRESVSCRRTSVRARVRSRARRVRARWSRKAKESFARGDLFEVVPGQTFFRACQQPPERGVPPAARDAIPRPTASSSTSATPSTWSAPRPRCSCASSGERVETCPISGTIARGGDAIADARQILALLNSQKDESELTMCTDVDRNDKSRVCEPETRARDRPAPDRDVLAS